MSAQPKIFVSTVTKEHKTAREQVARTLRHLGFEPVFQEEFTSHTGVVRAALEKELKPCAAVIQIVGHRYGWDLYDAKDPSESMSYTHYEAQYAHRHDLPIWYLVCADGYPGDCDNDEEENKRYLQTAYRIRVQRTGYLHYAVSDIKDIELMIYRMQDNLDVLRPVSLRRLRSGSEADAQAHFVASPPVGTAELETMMRGLLSEFVPALQQARQTSNADEEARREAELFARLGTMLGLAPAEARSEIEALAERRRADKHETLLNRAQAAYTLKDYAQAEDLALKAAQEAASRTPPDIDAQIDALVQAGQSARERIHFPSALEHYLAASALTSPQRDMSEWADIQCDIGWLYYHQGRYADQLALMRQVWQTGEQADQGEDPTVLRAHTLYANALDDQGRHVEAEQEYRAVLKVQKRVLGAEHPDTLMSRSNLAIALRAQGKYAEAEQEHRERIKIEARVLGTEHLDFLTSRNNLAEALRAQGKHGEAEDELRSVLKVKERVLGAEHPNTLSSRNNLAETWRAQGRHAEAEQEHRARIKIEERVLGVEHPVTLVSRNNLACALQNQGQNAEAEYEHRAVMQLRERVLGAEHPDVFLSCYNLAVCLAEQLKPKEAIMFMQRAEQGITRILGAEHPHSKNAKDGRERIEAALEK